MPWMVLATTVYLAEVPPKMKDRALQSSPHINGKEFKGEKKPSLFHIIPALVVTQQISLTGLLYQEKPGKQNASTDMPVPLSSQE
jgi:hypothetical protein